MSKENIVDDPNRRKRHSTSLVRKNEGTFMCPECGKNFDDKDIAEEHLHSEHMEHLQAVHEEFHSKDLNRQHRE